MLFVASPSTEPSGTPATSPMEKTITVKNEQEEDSETFPTPIVFRNISELKEQLKEFCGLTDTDDMTVKLVWEKKEILVSTEKILDEETYVVSCKIRLQLVKIYLCKQ